MTKERPILFNAEMVKSILDGRKAQTRRVIKPEPRLLFCDNDVVRWVCKKRVRSTLWNNGTGFNDFCPFGKVGDYLRVRESFTYIEEEKHGEDFLKYRDGTLRSLGEWEYPHPIYDHCVGRFGKWTPSIHAPRWASRITLEISGVRVERLQDISEEDCLSEGIENSGIYTNLTEFKTLWDSTNKKHPWQPNPWVWVIEFKRVGL